MARRLEAGCPGEATRAGTIAAGRGTPGPAGSGVGSGLGGAVAPATAAGLAAAPAGRGTVLAAGVDVLAGGDGRSRPLRSSPKASRTSSAAALAAAAEG